MEEQEARGQKRHEAAMDRMEKRHAREVQIQLEKDRVKLEGSLRSQTKQVRPSEAELEKVQVERCALIEQLDVVMTDNRGLLKTMGRERRHHDVEKRTMKEQCDNLERLMRRREKQDEGKRRQHIEAMGKADALRTTLELQKKALAKEEGQWRWKCAKQEQQLGVQQDALSVSTFGVEHARKTLIRMELNMAKREHTVAAKEVAAVKYRAKVEDERQVLHSQSSTFLFACGYPGTDCWVVAVPQQYHFYRYFRVRWSGQ
jgi:hypothetical protein